MKKEKPTTLLSNVPFFCYFFLFSFFLLFFPLKIKAMSLLNINSVDSSDNLNCGMKIGLTGGND